MWPRARGHMGGSAGALWDSEAFASCVTSPGPSGRITDHEPGFIVVISFICIYMTPLRDIKSEGFEHTHITIRSRGQEALDGLSILSHQEMHFEPINIARLTRNTPSIFLLLV